MPGRTNLDLSQARLPFLEYWPVVKAPLRSGLRPGLDDWPEFQVWEPREWRLPAFSALRARLHLMLKR